MQGRGAGPAPRGVVGVALSAALVMLALVVTAATPLEAEARKGKPKGPAAAVPKGAVRKLWRSRCPVPYENRVRRNYSEEEVRKARRWVFQVGGRELRLKPPIDWTQDPVGSASFRARLHDLRWLDVLTHAHRTTGQRGPMRQARRIAVNWVRRNLQRAPSTDRTWFDKVAADRAPMIGYVTRSARCRRVLPRKQARLLLGSAAQHGSFLSRDETHTTTNRGLFVDIGRLLLGRQVRFLPNAGRWRRQAEARFKRTAAELTFADEGFWLEHSTTYQFLALNVIERFLEIPGIAGEQLAKLVERMREMAGLLALPDKHWLQLGNSYREKAKPWVNRSRRAQASGLIVKPSSGLAFVNHKKKYLAFLATHYSDIHKHSDDLSFDLYDQNRRIVADTGLYHKDPNRFYEFSISAPAHSVLTVDGADFPRGDPAAYGSGIRATGKGAGWYGIDAVNLMLSAHGVNHRRLLLYKRGYGVIVADAVRSDRSHTYRRYFQLGTTIRAEGDAAGVALRDSDFGGRLDDSSTAPPTGFKLARAENDPMSGFLYPGFRERERRWTVELTTRGANVDHVASLAINRNRLLRAEPLGELGPASRFGLYRNGEPHSVLTVLQDGAGGLVITEEGQPYAPGTPASPDGEGPATPPAG